MKRGFTLVETAVIIGITVIALLGLINLFLTFNSLYLYQQAFIATSGSASSAMNALETTVPPADHILASTTFSGKVYSSATTTLVLELPSIDSSGNIVAGKKDYVVFYASSTSLFYQTTQADAQSTRTSGTKLLSTTLNALSFTYSSLNFTQATTVTADIQTQAVEKNQTVQSHLREQLYLRNL